MCVSPFEPGVAFLGFSGLGSILCCFVCYFVSFYFGMSGPPVVFDCSTLVAYN
jgi:hypothetical protein